MTCDAFMLQRCASDDNRRQNEDQEEWEEHKLLAEDCKRFGKRCDELARDPGKR